MVAALSAQPADRWREVFETGDVGLLYQLGVVVGFDWPLWRRTTTVDVAGAPVSDAVRLATSIVRAERFGGPAPDLDMLKPILDRLRRWYETER
ncbi:DUF6508 domain-containing protein [Nonomuraea sp. NPDC049152]|uniref:DUF6508 domain-containing protein n=1 Tax=Nonomuraea sp. NPDC049152 TaxID=3154350 RepID=UPI0033C12EA7